MQLGIKRGPAFLILGTLGIIVALLSGLEAHVPWIAVLCSGLTGGCRETALFTLMGVHLWIWGLAFYVLLLLFALRFPHWLHWLVALGVGVELSLVWTMLSTNIVCVFCIVNFVVIFSILFVILGRNNMWQCAAVCLFFLLISNAWIMRENRPLTHEVSAASMESPRVAAEVKGKPIMLREIEVPIAEKLFEFEQEAYNLKKELLDRLILEMLLQEEADRRGMSTQDVVRKEALSAGVEVSEDEVMQYYSENMSKWEGWSGPEDELKHRIRIHLQNLKSHRMVTQYAWSLAGEGEVKVYLQEPRLPLVHVNIEGSYSMGPEDSAVTVVEFSDYVCPVCRQTHGNVNQVRSLYEGKIRWVFKDYPLRQHRWAAKAAEAARCAGDQGKFWEYQDGIYSSGQELNPEELKAYARQLGLDEKSFNECLTGGKHAQAVLQDREDGRSSGITSTPTYIINGNVIRGAPALERFKEMIEAALVEKGRLSGEQ